MNSRRYPGRQDMSYRQRGTVITGESDDLTNKNWQIRARRQLLFGITMTWQRSQMALDLG
jgi:hypothetical protein